MQYKEFLCGHHLFIFSLYIHPKKNSHFSTVFVCVCVCARARAHGNVVFNVRLKFRSYLKSHMSISSTLRDKDNKALNKGFFPLSFSLCIKYYMQVVFLIYFFVNTNFLYMLPNST